MNQQAPIRQGNFIQTYSGVHFYPLDPRPEEILIEDIAHALSMQCRYAGHVNEFYSVAQHSVLVSHNVPKELALWGLLHDATEAYLVDIPRPIKPMLKGYAFIEDTLMREIAHKFYLKGRKIPEEVKRVDAAILVDESKALISHPTTGWTLPEPALGIDIIPWSPKEAEQRFMHRFLALTGPNHSYI